MLQLPSTAAGSQVAREPGAVASVLAGAALAGAGALLAGAVLPVPWCALGWAAPGAGASGTLHPDALTRAASSPAAPSLRVRVVK